MSTRYLLDTNILIAALKGAPGVRQQLEHTPLNALLLSTVVLGELEFGAEKSAWAARNRQRLNELTEEEVLAALDLEGATRRRRSVIDRLISRAARLNEIRYVRQLKEKYHGYQKEPDPR